MTQFTVSLDQHDQRLDVVLVANLNLSRSQIQKLIKAGAVKVNDVAPSVHQFLHTGDVVTVSEPATQSVDPTAESSPDQATAVHGEIVIIAEHPEYLVVNKPAGLPTHADNRYRRDTFIQQLVTRYPDIAAVGNDPTRPGLVHRLDKDVSGLLVVARTAAMFTHLKQQFQARTVLKRYIALVEGALTPAVGVIDFPISRGPEGLMVARPTNQAGKPALTEYVVTEYISHYSLVSIRLHTGRTHQIRAHCKAMGHSVVGDKLYTVKKQKADRYPLNRLFLHAGVLGFHDLTGQWQEYAAAIPAELTNYLRTIRPTTNLRPSNGGRNIALSGSPGSGKSTVTKKLAAKLNYERISMGDIRRQLAATKGMDLASFNQWSEEHPAGDVEVDRLWHDIALSGRGGIIAEGRMAPYFLPNAIRVFLYLPTAEAAKRIWTHWDEVKGNRNEDEQVSSASELATSLDSRIASDLRRYVQYYGMDPFDPIHYDIYLDVTDLDEVAEFDAVWSAIEPYLTK